MPTAAKVTGISPYLTVSDAAAAIGFYRDALGATERYRQMAQDGKRILHAELDLNGAVLMLSDPFPEFARAAPQQPNQPASVTVTLNLVSANQVDRLTANAVRHGAEIEMGPMDAFWGARFAAFRDPFGHRWMLNADRSG